MRPSTIKLIAVNHCPGADEVKRYLYMHNLQPYVQVVDLELAQASDHVNKDDMLVLAIGKGKTQTRVALALGQMALWFSVGELIWDVIDGIYIVRFWWN
jgi:hypothetical protein